MTAHQALLSLGFSRQEHWSGLPLPSLGIKTAGRKINNLTYVDNTTLMAESEEELKSLLMEVKEESKKSWLKTQHSKNEDHGIWYHLLHGKQIGKQWK